LVVTWLLEFGQMRYDHRGGIIYYFDRHSRRNLERVVGSRVVARLSDYLDAYIVASSSDEALVTVGHAEHAGDPSRLFLAVRSHR
jgi:hypothetical protein